MFGALFERDEDSPLPVGPIALNRARVGKYDPETQSSVGPHKVSGGQI